MTTPHWIALFALAAALVNGAGILFIHRHREWAERMKDPCLCFAGGILITAPLLVALPQAARLHAHAGASALAGFLFMYFSNELLRRATRKRDVAFGMTAAEGIGLHSFIDGVIYTVTFKASTLVGVLAATGLVIHEFAEGVITYLFLVRGGFRARTAAGAAFLVAGCTTPLGALVVYPLVSRLSPQWIGLLLGFVAGVLLYVSAAHLLPESRAQGHRHSYVAFLAGIALAVFIVSVKHA